MALMDNKKSYNFETYAPSLLGTAFKNVEVVGVFPYETAIVLYGELAPLHAEIYSTGNLPIGTPDDPRQYNYYRIKKADGSFVILGEPWIDQTSIVEVTSGTVTITIPKQTQTDLSRLRVALLQNGIVDFEIKFNS